MKNLKPKTTVQALRLFADAWKKKDFETAKITFNYICENNSPDEVDKYFLANISVAMDMFKFFHETGLVDAPTGSPTRLFFFRIVRYIIENETPAIKQAFEETFNELFPDFVPVGFNENGDHLYSLDDLAKSLDVSAEHLLNEAKSIPDFKIIRVDNPPDGTTVH